ncbi:ABC transporter ATP-binding protein [uncultured Alistipes sp.]|jgi:multidrug ABC transporter, permease/ATP-binding protein|uniref:ABC transporter ATP-binding protein n=1 Tax=uncultured Alistipes sp. TaxID=538949 RepID=UPI0025DBB0B3|nr:ABC transporter ATP-binding protein [uncultured Alistipes sp.]
MKEAISIIPHKFRHRGIGVALTLLLRAGLNFLGLAVLLPVLALVLDPGSLQGDGPLARIYTLLGFVSPRNFAFAVCGAVVMVIVVKCIVNLWLARVERNYIYDLYRALSRQLYITYHERGLSFVKSSNSAVLARNVNVVCLQFTAGILKPAAAIAAETLLLLFLFGAMLWYTPVAALLAIAVFVPSIWIYYGLVRNRINRYGELENKAQREKARLVGETFRGYADIEINNAFPMMLRAFEKAMDQVIRNRKRETMIGLLPQILTEIGLAVGIALLVALSLDAGDGRAQLLFGVFAVAALRLMPSIRSIMSGWTAIKYNRYTIDILRDAEQKETASTSGIKAVSTATCEMECNTEKLPFEHEIAVHDVAFSFADNGHELFHGLTLSIRKGERIGIRGASGAGKTTLFNLLLGLYEPTAGDIAIDGIRLTPANRRAWQNRIGYVSQSLFIADGSFAANVALGIPEEEVDRDLVIKALETAQMGEFIAGLANGIDTHVGECGCRLSGGQRQRIGIARALYRQADVLFFDEATSALDSRTEEDINRSIAALAADNAALTLVIIAHRESSLEYCNRIITIGE